MSISNRYTEILKQINQTLSLNDLISVNSGVGLRHDIDYDLDLALEFAHLEHSMGYSATYFLLDTAAYWNESDFADKALQIQDFGHEIGLHVNSVAKWVSGKIKSPEGDFLQNLRTLRDIGLNVNGVAAHGDADCYKFNVANYWMFSELKPENPFASENGITAEGVFDSSSDRVLFYPVTHIAKNTNGDELLLWQTSMLKHGVKYHAAHENYDFYFSDSGGKWRNNLDPLQQQFDDKKTQILIHPEHWRGDKKIYFFLSTARSSSKWLSEVLNTGTSCRGEHEFTLNFQSDGHHEPKNTQTNFQEIQTNDALARQLILDSATYINTQKHDWAECNVYLPHTLTQLQATFPNAKFIHIRRKTEDVVNSLINRNWYDTPNDYIHPIVDFDHYNAKSQIQRCLAYVTFTNNKISGHTSTTLSQSKLVTDFEYFKTEIEGLGIPVYPRLVAKVYHQLINKNKTEIYASPLDWSSEMQAEYKIVAEIIQNKTPQQPQKSNTTKTNPTSILRYPRSVFRHSFWTTAVFKSRLRCWNMKLSKKVSSFYLATVPNKNCYASLGGSEWRNSQKGAGLAINDGHYFDGHILIHSEMDTPIKIFVIFYEVMSQTHKRLMYNGRASGEKVKFSFSPPPKATKFDIFIHVSPNPEMLSLSIKDFAVNMIK
tara:strand:- start:2202 stop:4172 length:1971 start_codon:yes stop_codon:yes gene_type:complete